MADRSELVRYYLIAVVGSLVVFTLAYDYGMSAFEGRPRTLLDALEVVLQTYTTTGYGQDAPWQHPVMVILVIAMQMSSLVLIFAAFPIFIVPFFEDVIQTTPPEERPDLTDHVVICGYNPTSETIIDQMETREIDHVVVEPDRETAVELYENERSVVHADPETEAGLGGANVESAKAVVSDSDDDVDLSIIMTAQRLAPAVPVYSVVADPSFRTYHEYAGVTDVFTPRELLGQGLANKVRNAFSTDVDTIDLGENFKIGELPIHPGSELRGQQVGDTRLTDLSGARLIGAWAHGEFWTPPFPDLVLDEHTVLLVSGREKRLEALKRLTLSEIRRYDRGEVIVAGNGVVGSTITDTLADEAVPYTVIDREDSPGVDVVGDVTDKTVLRDAGVEDARTIVLALDDDRTTLLATFVIRELNQDAEIVARAEDTENVRKLYQAGADYVLALAAVTGRLLTSTILDNEEVLSVDRQMDVSRKPAEPVAGQTLEEARITERTGCTVVAIERRDGRIETDLSDWTEIGEMDTLIVAGLDSDVQQFDEVFLTE